MPFLNPYRPPFKVWRINRLESLRRRFGKPPLDLSEESLFAKARAFARCEDWGEDDFLPAFQALLHGFETEAGLSATGRDVVQKNMIRGLYNRLQIHKTLTECPEILDTPIHAPIFIVGFPRTGTTLLHNLLAQNPDFRAPLMWELLFPCPPPDPKNHAADPRIAMVQGGLDKFYESTPKMRAIHYWTALSPEECLHLFANAFINPLVDFDGPLPSYMAWLQQQDLRAAYRYYRKQLQILQWRFPQRTWALKSPLHLFRLDALLEVFPDARVIHTHRDPAAFLASLCSMVAVRQNVMCDRVDLAGIGRDYLARMQRFIENAAAARAKHDDAAFFDCNYDDLVADPIAMTRRIFDRFGLDMNPEGEANMRRWLAENRKGKHGRHRYKLEWFGLERDLVKTAFGDYPAQFTAGA